MLSKKQLEDVCLINSTDGRKCRYLSQDDFDDSIYVCAKLTSMAKEIDKNIKLHLDECKKTNRDPYENGDPCGNNCKGYPPLKHVEQGYDI